MIVYFVVFTLLGLCCQYVEYYMNKGVLGVMKTVSHKVWEYQAAPVRPHHTARQDRLQEDLQLPPIPPTLLDVCGLIQIHYVLKVEYLH